MNKLKIRDYRRGAVRYIQSDPYFSHNVERDYQIVLLEEDCFGDTKLHSDQRYQLVAEYDLTWTQKHLADNKNRLGVHADILLGKADQDQIQLKALILEIESPGYQLTSAGAYCSRWAAGSAGDLLSEAVLHSDNIETFFYFAALLIGPEFVDDLTSRGSVVRKTVSRKDLAGADGWDSFQQMFSVTNLCCDWVVLRNGDVLPDRFWGNDNDLDILCRDPVGYRLAANLSRRGEGLSSFEVNIQSRMVDVDARFLGDEYYDRLWQADMLATKEFEGVVPLLNLENHFFSLLYHARVHKSAVKPAYVSRLCNMACSLGFDLNRAVLSDDRACARFLDSYFENKGYKLTYPYDYACYQNVNRNVSSHFVNIKSTDFNWKFSLRYIKHKVFGNASGFVRQLLRENVKRAFKR